MGDYYETLKNEKLHYMWKESYWMALGNYIDVKVISGYCNDHLQESINDEDVVQGKPYDSDLMGKCIPLFE